LPKQILSWFSTLDSDLLNFLKIWPINLRNSWMYIILILVQLISIIQLYYYYLSCLLRLILWQKSQKNWIILVWKLRIQNEKLLCRTDLVSIYFIWDSNRVIWDSSYFSKYYYLNFFVIFIYIFNKFIQEIGISLLLITIFLRQNESTFFHFICNYHHNPPEHFTRHKPHYYI